MFSATTNEEGYALLPGFARKYSAAIYKNDFFPAFIDRLSSDIYIIEPTPKMLRPLGDIEGEGIRFDQGALITIGYVGDYHVYQFDDQGAKEIGSAQLAKCVRCKRLLGDTLWYSTHDDGIYVYSLEYYLNPKLLFHLEIPGYLDAFAIKDTIITVSNFGDKEPLRIYSYHTNGQYNKVTEFGNYSINDMKFFSDYLVILTYNDNLPSVIDLSDPANPILVYNGIEPDYWSGFFYQDNVVLIPRDIWGDGEWPRHYKLVDLSDPAHPRSAGLFPADSRLYDIIGNNSAVGAYHGTIYAISVLDGDVANGFQTTAIETRGTSMQEYGGASPPYFIIGNQLWRLEG
ncbi:MAG TPA: hypothetical protein EYP58_03330 [bacterium (Candidatus Stahlbacteria)]|nr:hypothetical protein [Candidatus Stahlbacteria bacterium]